MNQESVVSSWKDKLKTHQVDYEQITEDSTSLTIKPNINALQLSQAKKVHNHQNSQHLTTIIDNYDNFLFQRILQIQKPEVIKEGYLVSYKLYTIKSRKKNCQYYDTIVHRRFNDFQFLHHELIENYGGCVLPRLPEKNILAKFDIEEKQFQQSRVKLLENYLTYLINHKRVRYSLQFRNFLFLEDIKFSFQKGKFAEDSAFSNQFNEIKSSVIGVTKMIYQKIVGVKQHNITFSKETDEERQLKLFEREIEDLMKIIKEIKPIIEESHEQFMIITDINLSDHDGTKADKKEKDYLDRFKNIISEFEEITGFVNNCFDAIQRTKQLRSEIEQLEQNLKQMEMKERNNPRKIELDIMRGQIQKKNNRYQKWLSFLKKQLQIYTNEGKTLMQHFVRKFNILKGEAYAFFNDTE